MIGKSITRIDAMGKVRGDALYPGDINLPNQIYAKVLFANRPSAIIKKINTSLAESFPGVVAVLTARDIPVNEHGLFTFDSPVFIGPGSSKINADHIRYVGEKLALVLAETESIASIALEKIIVEIEEKEAVLDPLDAIKQDAPLVHPELSSNIFNHYLVEKGNIEDGFNKSDVLLECEYRTPAQEHAFLQTEAGIAYVDDDEIITVVVAGQWAHEDQAQIAHALNLPKDRVRVIYPAIGGAFGGREDMTIQIILALAAWRLKQQGRSRPVKLVWNREESIKSHCKRQALIFKTKWGAKKNGKVIAVQEEIFQDGGAYASTSTAILGSAVLTSTGPYSIENIEINGYSVYTNNIPGGAFRGFGAPQGSFVAESQMNKLADILHIDPIEIREMNLFSDGDTLSIGTPLPEGVSIDRVVEKCAIESGWKRSKSKWIRTSSTDRNLTSTSDIRRGNGFACAFKNVGFSFGAIEASSATIELHGEVEIEEVIVRHAGAEVGQGVHTAIVQMVAEELGVELGKIQLITSDTSYTNDSGSVAASRMTFMAGNAIIGAAKEGLIRWKCEDRPAIGNYTYCPPKTAPIGSLTSVKPYFAHGYVAGSATVDVDLATGKIDVVKVVCALDVGKAINPKQIVGQIEGGIVQAIGWTLMENFLQEGGYIQTDSFSTYLIPSVLDIPLSIESFIVEVPDPIGPWGVRGIGEMPFLPIAPAVIAAVHDALGVWFDEFPITPEKVLRGISLLDERTD